MTETAEAEYRSGSKCFRIDEDALVSDSERIRFADVTRVRIYVFQGIACCLVSGASGKPIVITTKRRPSVDEAEDYIAFVEATHDRIAEAAPEAEFIGGHAAFFALLVVCLVGIAAVLVTFIAALASGASAARVGPLLGAVILPLMVLASTTSGRPRKYDPHEIPGKFLPTAG